MELPKPGLVAVGGVCGAATRWLAFELTDHAAWSLLAVNSIGAFLLGLLVQGRGRGERARLLLGVGFCGSLTTFSTLAVDIANDLDRGAAADGLLLLTLSLGLGLLAASIGAAKRRPSP